MHTEGLFDPIFLICGYKAVAGTDVGVAVALRAMSLGECDPFYQPSLKISSGLELVFFLIVVTYWFRDEISQI